MLCVILCALRILASVYLCLLIDQAPAPFVYKTHEILNKRSRERVSLVGTHPKSTFLIAYHMFCIVKGPVPGLLILMNTNKQMREF